MVATLQNKLDLALENVMVPWLGETVAVAGGKAEIAADSTPTLRLKLGFPVGRAAHSIASQIRSELSAACDTDVKVELSWKVHAHSVQGTLSPIEGIKNIVAVSSAKGGVGKSTVAVNLALALAAEGARVGMLDADIYGPSQPTMLGVAGEQPVSRDGKTFESIQAHGLAMISIGCLIDTEQPTVWRGPMVTQALNQLLFQTNWPDLDYLFIDMPPGTGDIQLTLSQKVPVSGAVIVTTPQDIALLDAVRGLRMFEKVHIPVLGLIENMSSFACPGCGDVTPLFGAGGGVEVAKRNDLRLLGQLPLDLRIREETDAGQPTVVADPDSPVAQLFTEVALALAAQLATRPRDYNHAFGSVKIEPA